MNVTQDGLLIVFGWLENVAVNREKMLVTSLFLFSFSVFQRLSLSESKNVGIIGGRGGERGF